MIEKFCHFSQLQYIAPLDIMKLPEVWQKERVYKMIEQKEKLLNLLLALNLAAYDQTSAAFNYGMQVGKGTENIDEAGENLKKLGNRFQDLFKEVINLL